MMALSEFPTDLTTPLQPPQVLSWFDSLSAGRCTLPQLSRWVLETCRVDPGAAAGVLLLLEEYGKAGKLKQFDFRPLQRELKRRVRQSESPLQDQPPLQDHPPPQNQDQPQSQESAKAVEKADMRLAKPRANPDPNPTHPLPSAGHSAEVNHAEVAAAGEPSAAPAAPVGPTTVLRDRYVLHDEIGRGGAGTVYLAFDRNRAGLPHEQQFVALKVLRQEHARRPETLHALRREFHQAQSLSHPGIVNVFDFDHEGETYFVTMELLNGEPLGVLMRHALPHTLDRELATRILRELGDAIAYAHERDVLHLDLKPGNVMVVDGHVRVLDFGLAQTFMAEPWISEMPLPRAATPAYASCERLLGDLPDVRDDIFSYACLAYELLSGQHPFDRGSALEAQSAGHKPRRIRGLSHGQWRALKRGLAWSRADRSEGMQELIDGLALPVATSRHGVRRRAQARTSVAAPRWSVAALALLVLGVVAVLGWNFLPRELRASVVDQAAVTGSILGDTAETVRDRVVALSTTPADHLEPRASSAPSATPQAPPSEQGVPLSAPPPMSDPVVSNIQPPVVESPPVQIPAVETPAVASTAQPTRPTSAIADPPAEAAVSTAADTAVSTIPDRSAGGPGAVEFASDTVTVSESNSTARVKVRRRGGAAGEISFVWRTLDDTALAGEDYASGEVRETMASGQTTATLLIPIVGDSIAEHTELLDVVLDDTSGAELGSLTRASVIIVDDD